MSVCEMVIITDSVSPQQKNEKKKRKERKGMPSRCEVFHFSTADGKRSIINLSCITKNAMIFSGLCCEIFISVVLLTDG